MAPNMRLRLYRVCIAVLPLLALYGLITDEAVPIWASFLGAAYANFVASQNVPTDES
jgi:hypothetical protein